MHVISYYANVCSHLSPPLSRSIESYHNYDYNKSNPIFAMIPTLGYKKSRTGCSRCKQRKVKCDEQVPCTACVRHKVPCTLATSTVVVGSDDHCLSTSQQRDYHLPGHASLLSEFLQDVHHTQSPGISDPGSVQQSEEDLSPDEDPDEAQAWLRDLELMHHYATITCHKMPRANEHLQLWQLEIPRLAAHHSYLMHQVLATAAHHLAYLHPADRDSVELEALRHHSSTVKSFHKSIQNLNEESCHAVFGAAMLVIINTFASYSSTTQIGTSSKLGDLLGSFILIRGMNGILKSFEHLLQGGPLGPLLLLSKRPSSLSLLDPLIQRLHKLLSDFRDDSSDMAVCRQAVHHFIHTIEQAMATSDSPLSRIIMHWPIAISDDFLTLLQQRQRTALVVLSYYGVVLVSAGFDVWFLERWGQQLLQEIETLVGSQTDSLRWQLDTPKKDLRPHF
ncbi:hypothetical protein GGR58DRAFT_467480 [Xylaria digitata]|nr:hypothetical protein GGR58DRAFT_467480 [Xylaria digitata]